ncbi:hypothetical protein THF1C08_60176 [Vibrio jasicida]|uniref:Uncharacterized protein n=1 Tax=Vibrio jasicida TaxID=766224 RepID=A0AAU9QPE1_9VIBR|nr:hypothetical protein THF1A12_30061 [Vibrio jasicida]CAH1600536.1 hypothetical protein THF1C08_60176 [Vibrio jasicida]
MVGNYSDYWLKTTPKELADTNDDKGEADIDELVALS